MKKGGKIDNILFYLLPIILGPCLICFIFPLLFGELFSFKMNHKQTEAYFQEYREELCTVADYMTHLEYCFAYISSEQSDEIIITCFTGSEKIEEKILHSNVSNAIRVLFGKGGCKTIEKNNDDVTFDLWSVHDIDGGIAYSVSGVHNPHFITTRFPLSESNWFYYLREYNKMS